MPAVEVDELTKRYGQRAALDGVSFTVDAGECLALLGPNGAGKSTLVEILATLTEPTSGQAHLAGASVTEAPHEVRRRIGVAFQTPITHDHLTAREVVLHHAKVYGLPREDAEERADELLAFVDLADRADDRVGDFSGGMKRRVDLARVLVTEPDVLLLDEPAAGLDPRGRRQIRDRLAQLRNEGTTLVVATHQIREAEALADRVAVLDQGRIRAEGVPTELTAGLGEHVVRVRVASEADRELVRGELASLGVDQIHDDPDGLEVVIEGTTPSPGEIVDGLDRAGLAYEEVAVREPDLSDVFLDVTGRSLDEPQEEVPA